MQDLIGSVAHLTGYRDRDLLDTTVVSVLGDWLQPQGLSMYRCVGEPAAPRLLRLASARAGSLPEVGDPPWTPLEGLPSLSDWPVHRGVFLCGQPALDLPLPGGRPGLRLSVFPVIVGERCTGVIELQCTEPMTLDRQRLVDGVLKIYRNQIGLLDYSERDTLTGLLNRKSFDEQFGKCLLEDAACRDAMAPASAADGERRRAMAGMRHWIGVADIDHFKRVNDRHGHLIGDEVLLLVAQLLRSSFRQGDLLYRFGGEEFVLLLRADSRATASQAFERFRQQMEAFRFPQAGSVTISLGFSELRVPDTPSGAFERADQAVYYAKAHGRNRVCCHEALIETGGLEANDKVGEIELF